MSKIVSEKILENLLFIWPNTAQCGPAQRGETRAGLLTRAPGRNLGLGRESSAPPQPKGAQLPLTLCGRRIRSDGRPAVAAGTKPGPQHAPPQTLDALLPLPFGLSCLLLATATEAMAPPWASSPASALACT
jgi:hypothetical protein